MEPMTMLAAGGLLSGLLGGGGTKVSQTATQNQGVSINPVFNVTSPGAYTIPTSTLSNNQVPTTNQVSQPADTPSLLGYGGGFLPSQGVNDLGNGTAINKDTGGSFFFIVLMAIGAIIILSED